jgi:hypothetical protein
MARSKQSQGKCGFCGQEFTKSGVNRHMAACTSWQAAMAKAENSKRKSDTLYHLRVQAAGQPPFWLDLGMRGAAKLKDLDDYLRAIWLECCGHLSQFSRGGWGGQEIAMSRRIEEAFASGQELTHIYDFGTESVSLIKPVGQRLGKPVTTRPIVLLARNVTPVVACQECQQPASWLCMECVIEEDAQGVLCDQHAKNHPHEDYGDPVPLVNSPRLGLCGYDGPAEPPY